MKYADILRGVYSVRMFLNVHRSRARIAPSRRIDHLTVQRIVVRPNAIDSPPRDRHLIWFAEICSQCWSVSVEQAEV